MGNLKCTNCSNFDIAVRTTGSSGTVVSSGSTRPQSTTVRSGTSQPVQSGTRVVSSGSSQPVQGATRVVSSGLSQGTRVASGSAPRPVSTVGSTRVTAPVARESYVPRAPVQYSTQGYYHGSNQMGGVIVEEYSEAGPIIAGVHPATELTGDRLSPISARPGPDARIPYAPPSVYVPSDSDTRSYTINSVGGSGS